MNDKQFVEAARKLAERMMSEGGTTAAERAAYGFRLTTARVPTAAESAVLAGTILPSGLFLSDTPDSAITVGDVKASGSSRKTWCCARGTAMKGTSGP